jgi:hypothetical protein
MNSFSGFLLGGKFDFLFDFGCKKIAFGMFVGILDFNE